MTVRVKRLVLLGAAGRDFHDFNVVFRDDPDITVVAFTATQIPGIDRRRYPPELAGSRYPDGIPIVAERELESLIRDQAIDQVVFAYSDVDHAHVMRMASRVLAAGADFTLLGPHTTMLRANVPVIAVCAVRTGCGKSQVARHLSAHLNDRGIATAVIRHPMPYGDLSRQVVQRFASMSDLDAADCTLEEREEYEPHIAAGGVVFAGADYAAVLRAAEQEAALILWDGGNNDFSFIRPDLTLVVVDALRPDQLDTHYPGAAVLRTADLVVVNKLDAATEAQRQTVDATLDRLLPAVERIYADSPVTLDDPEALTGARVLVVEDGPTITHGGMPTGAGYHAVRQLPVAEIVDPRPFASPSLRAVFERYSHIGPVLPAMGYSRAELAALRATVEAAGVDVVVAGTPIDLARALNVSVPVVRARYSYRDHAAPGLASRVDALLDAHLKTTDTAATHER
ncbi:MAG: cyclic 2,3-diphosphoglycerate synthase [Pseudomonadales bacterium]